MNALKAKKFRVGDEVEIVSLTNTIKRFGGEDFVLQIGSISVVKAICEDNDGIELEDDLLYYTDDLKIIKSADAINTSQNESIDPSFKSDVLLPKTDEDAFSCCLGKGIESKTYNPLIAQEGGGHYKNRGIQPIEYSHANNLSASQHSVVKYITRYYDKGGIEDLSKIVHFVLLEAYFRYGEQGSTELKDKILTILGENKES